MQAGLCAAGLALGCHRSPAQVSPQSKVFLAHNASREIALKTALRLPGRMDLGGEDIYLKANYNSPDPFPATTHPETLRLVAGFLRESKCGRITLVERSGMGLTRDIWEKLGVPDLARQLDINLLDLDEVPADKWRKVDLPPGSSWKSGIEIPAFLDHDACVVQIANLKTHRFGAIFSASLKNSLGLIAKNGHVNAGYNYMAELHASTQQGSMIADVNQVYEPRLIIMDAMQVFVSGGPETGDLGTPEAVLTSDDRVAIDAAGIALLRLHMEFPGHPLSRNSVYEQEQIKRAAELNLGASDATGIQFVTAEARSSMLASQLEGMLASVNKSSKF